MRKLVFSVIAILFSGFFYAQQLAFPGAEGAGRYTTGGRGGTVYEVTNLLDAGVGSLRYGLETLTGARTIIFKVSGTIALKSQLQIKNGNVTIAGQTAPGDGICTKGYGVEVKASNVIARYLHCRPGDYELVEVDAFSGRGYSNIIIDHCSVSWSVDEIASFYDNSNFTMQWCMLSESLKNSVHGKGSHGYTGIWGGKKATFHHNLLAHSDSRNPRLCGSRYSALPDQELVDVRNNVMYNYGGNSGYGGEGGSANFINNYYKPGPATTNSTIKTRIFAPNPDTGTNDQNGVVWGKYWLSENYVDGSTAVTTDNWQGLHPTLGTFVSVKGPAMTVTLAKEDYMLNAEVPFSVVNTQTALNAYSSVLDNAGASYVRDTVDRRIIRETRNKTYTFTGSNGGKNGFIDTQSDVGGWSVLNSATPPTDTDKDGMPDVWETARGLNPNDAADRNNVDHDGYTMLEKYLNSIEFNSPVTSYQLTKQSDNSLKLQWSDNYLAEDGFNVERSFDGKNFVTIAESLPKYTNTYIDNSVNNKPYVVYRVIAYNNDNITTPATTSISYTINTAIDDLTLAENIKCYPNPFRDKICFDVPVTENQKVQARIFDLTGKLVATADKTNIQIAENKLIWNDKATLGVIKSGVYVCKLTVGDYSSNNIILLK